MYSALEYTVRLSLPVIELIMLICGEKIEISHVKQRIIIFIKRQLMNPYVYICSCTVKGI